MRSGPEQTFIRKKARAAYRNTDIYALNQTFQDEQEVKIAAELAFDNF